MGSSNTTSSALAGRSPWGAAAPRPRLAGSSSAQLPLSTVAAAADHCPHQMAQPLLLSLPLALAAAVSPHPSMLGAGIYPPSCLQFH